MKIISETQEEMPFIPGCDMMRYPPYRKELTEEEELECTVTFFGSLLDGGYDKC
ncbi:hypothetical protein SEA_MOAB_109 [Streptomyces phage Moab]|nr:hypothetical protein SEA_MOAB_109 [Streptomyces phage Moab]WMI33736.1 hypothetical protein SEA_PATELGO_110 [Streptomyces phage Patelgo]